MKKLLFISMFAALLAVGCEEADGFEEEQTPPDVEQTPGDDGNADADPTEILLSTKIEVLTRTAYPALDTQIAKDEQVAVWVDNNADGSQLYGKNVLTADGNGNLTGGTPMYFPQNDDNVNIYALHTNASLSGTDYPAEAITHTVSTDQRTQAGYAASDLLYATAKNVSKTDNAISLTFRHLLSKAQLAIVLTGGLTAADIQSISLSGLKSSASLSLNKSAAPEELTVEATGETADINIGTDVSADFTDSGVQYNEAVVVPQAVDAQTALLTVTLTDGTVLVFDAPADTAFESGKKYALHMSVSRTGIRLSTSVSDWEPGDDLFPGGDEQIREPLAAVDAETIVFTRNEEIYDRATLNMKWGKIADADAYHIDVVLKSLITDNGVETPDEAIVSHKTTELETFNCEFNFEIQNGGTYEISIFAIGDGEFFTDSEITTTEYMWYAAPDNDSNSALGGVPAGDLAVVLPELLKDVTGNEVTFSLVADRAYTLDSPVDFGAYNVTIKSVINVGTDEEPILEDSDKHAVITYGLNGVFRTGNSLTLKNLSIDATAQYNIYDNTRPEYVRERTSPGWGIVEGSFDQTALAAASQAGLDLNNYLLNNITFDGCYIKNVTCNLTHFGDYAWEYGTIKVTNSIIQLNSDGSQHSDATVLGTYGGGIAPDGNINWRVGAIRDLIVENSTIYNIKNNDRNRMIRWNGNSIRHHFVPGTSASITFDRVTLSQTMSGKEFANGTWRISDDDNYVTFTFTNSVYRDCYRVFNRINARNLTYKIENNLGWWSGHTTTNGWIETGDMEDDADVLEEIGGVNWTAFTFAGETYKELDFNASDGHGVNFKASAASSTQGDPRWNITR